MEDFFNRDLGAKVLFLTIVCCINISQGDVVLHGVGHGQQGRRQIAIVKVSESVVVDWLKMLVLVGLVVVLVLVVKVVPVIF